MSLRSETSKIVPLSVGPCVRWESNASELSEGANEHPSRLIPYQRTIVDSLLLVCLLAMVSFVTIRPSRSMDEDLWWHVRTGTWIVQHRSIPAQDSFALHTMGKPWVAYSWLFELLVSNVYAYWGLRGILAVTELLMLACMASIVGLLSRYTNLVRAITLGAAVLLAIVPLAAPRPWLFTIIFFVLELYLLLRARERGSAKSLWLVIPLLALWANVHIQFVYGLGLIVLFALERPVGSLANWPTPSARLHSRWFWSLLPVACLATLVNPYGWRLYTVVLQYASESVPLRIVYEMQAMDFRGITDWAALLLVCSAFYAQAGSQNKSPLMLSLLGVSCWFGFRSGRDVWFLAIASALAMASSVRGYADNRRHRSRWKEWAIALPIGLALAFATLQSRSVSEIRLRQEMAKRFPEKAVTYLESHALRGPLFNSYGWGGYLIWRLPNMRVSIDGRANLQGDQHLARWARTYEGKRDWAEDPDLAKANTILLERDAPLASILRSDARYRLVYEDEIASVFQPARAQNNSQ